MATATLNDWVNNTGSGLSGELVNISFHSTSTRALIVYLQNQAINGSNNLVITDAALAAGTSYVWIAESPSQSTWFASGRVTAA